MVLLRTLSSYDYFITQSVIHNPDIFMTHSQVDAGALDSAQCSAMERVEAMLAAGVGDSAMKHRLEKVVALLAEADIVSQIQRQQTEGVSVAEGQRVRDYMQSLVPGPINEFWPKVMISYATGRRTGLDGEGCGLGMQYAHLLARTLNRHGISCFSGLHVAGGQVGQETTNIYPTRQQHLSG